MMKVDADLVYASPKPSWSTPRNSSRHPQGAEWDLADALGRRHPLSSRCGEVPEGERRPQVDRTNRMSRRSACKDLLASGNSPREAFQPGFKASKSIMSTGRIIEDAEGAAMQILM